MDFLTEVDKLVQLLECPIFTCEIWATLRWGGGCFVEDTGPGDLLRLRREKRGSHCLSYGPQGVPSAGLTALGGTWPGCPAPPSLPPSPTLPASDTLAK